MCPWHISVERVNPFWALSPRPCFDVFMTLTWTGREPGGYELRMVPEAGSILQRDLFPLYLPVAIMYGCIEECLCYAFKLWIPFYIKNDVGHSDPSLSTFLVSLVLQQMIVCLRLSTLDFTRILLLHAIDKQEEAPFKMSGGKNWIHTEQLGIRIQREFWSTNCQHSFLSLFICMIATRVHYKIANSLPLRNLQEHYSVMYSLRRLHCAC